MYVDAIQDYRKDLIKAVERINGKRIFREFPLCANFLRNTQMVTYLPFMVLSPLSELSPTHAR